MEFKPMLTPPSVTDKNWINYQKGGYNYCVMMNKTTGSVLPNCTGFAWGRWRQLLGSKPKLSVNQAEIWWFKEDGYERGQEPKLGAIACWSKGDPKNWKDGEGHVATVEVINPDGSYIAGMSGSHSKSRFWTEHIIDNHYKDGYDFQGFIYLPINFDDKPVPEPTPEPEPTPTNELKVGDKVKIIAKGNGSSMGMANTAYGIGWTREILKVWEGRPFPYQVGNASGTTGFYKREALEKL